MFIIDEIIDKLNDMEELADDPMDTAFMIWEDENITGSVTCNTQEAIEWIAENFYEIRDVALEFQQNTGEILDVFKDPEGVQVILYIEMTANILCEVWEDGITKEELIERLERKC